MANEKIYIVEDKAIIALEIKRSILKLGYSFAGMASNYEEGLKGILENKPDLILMDIMLEGSKSGIDLAQSLKGKTDAIPIIYLTSVTDNDIQDEAIKTLPASYLLKPFRREELRSAISLTLYKESLQTSLHEDTVEIGEGYRYNLREDLLFLHNKPIKLSAKERRLLHCLIQAKGKVVGFRVLEEAIWQGEHISDSSFRTLLWRLHQKLGYKLVETIPTFGCRARLNDA